MFFVKSFVPDASIRKKCTSPNVDLLGCPVHFSLCSGMLLFYDTHIQGRGGAKLYQDDTELATDSGGGASAHS